MKTITPAMLAHLQSECTTLAMLWLVKLRDGTILGFTNHDQDITFGGVLFKRSSGAQMSAIELTSDLSTSNLEIDAIFTGVDITQADIEAARFDYASITVSLVNFMDLTMGAVPLQTGLTGQFAVMDGMYKSEVRSLSQILQQTQGKIFSQICRVNLGDPACGVNPTTVTGSVQSIINATKWNDSTLTQTGPTASFVDTLGRTIESVPPYQIQVVPPTGGAWVSNDGVIGYDGRGWNAVGGSPGPKQYQVLGAGLYQFNIADRGQQVRINYEYTTGFFTYGIVKWLTGANAGYSMEVKGNSPGVVELTMLMPFPIQVGDTYQISEGCDGLFGTCKSRFNNVVNFQGEPYIPGPDLILRPQWN